MKFRWSAVAAVAAIFTLGWTVFTAVVSLPSWRQSNFPGDWPGNDVACSEGFTPTTDRCDAGSVGMVAVCWDDQTFKNSETPQGCKGMKSFCTYKSLSQVNLASTSPLGKHPGRVWQCQTGMHF